MKLLAICSCYQFRIVLFSFYLFLPLNSLNLVIREYILHRQGFILSDYCLPKYFVSVPYMLILNNLKPRSQNCKNKLKNSLRITALEYVKDTKCIIGLNASY